QGESPPGQLRVRDVKPRLVHYPVSPEEDVQVEEARTPALCPDAPVRSLDVQESSQQRGRAAGRDEGGDGVPDTGLCRADGGGGGERGAAAELDVGEGAEVLDGGDEHALGIAEVRAEPQVNDVRARRGAAHRPSTSRIPYWPGGWPRTQSAARSAPLANWSRL